MPMTMLLPSFAIIKIAIIMTRRVFILAARDVNSSLALYHHYHV